MRRIGLLVTAACVTGWVGLAGAATFTVNDLGDGADANAGDGVCATSGAVCTLRAAMAEANALAGADTIAFDSGGTITVGSALPVISQALTIDGSTAISTPGNPVSPSTASAPRSLASTSTTRPRRARSRTSP